MKNSKNQVSRGLRNNNPLNIRRTADLWQGLKPEQTDPEFFQFKTIAWGYRAAFVVLRTYRHRYGADTIDRIVKRWAPPGDRNDTEYYIRKVAVLTGLDRHETIDADNPREMAELVAAMSRVENGVPARMDEVYAGWKLYMG